MKQLFVIVLSTAAICAFASATPAAAQEAADPVNTQDQTPYMQQSDRTHAYTASSADPANEGCSVIEESRAEGGHSEHTVVCPQSCKRPAAQP
jgi:hypothetical protein